VVESLTKQTCSLVDSKLDRRDIIVSVGQESHAPPVLVCYKSQACLVNAGPRSHYVPHKQLSNLTGWRYFQILCPYTVCEGRLNPLLFYMNKNKCLLMFLSIGCSQTQEEPGKNKKLTVISSQCLKLLISY
jgi:hypothetical protein